MKLVLQAKGKPADFLFDNLKTHLASGPVKFRLEVQLPNAGDVNHIGEDEEKLATEVRQIFDSIEIVSTNSMTKP